MLRCVAGIAAVLEMGTLWRITYGLRGCSLLSDGLSVHGHTPKSAFLLNLCVSKSVIPLLRVTDKEETEG